jgi:hypothetical protein
LGIRFAGPGDGGVLRNAFLKARRPHLAAARGQSMKHLRSRNQQCDRFRGFARKLQQLSGSKIGQRPHRGPNLIGRQFDGEGGIEQPRIIRCRDSACPRGLR